MGIIEQGGDEETGAAPDHNRDEAQVVAETAQQGSESPHARIALAAVVAFLVVDAHKLAAVGADNRSFSLPFEHPILFEKFPDHQYTI